MVLIKLNLVLILCAIELILVEVVPGVNVFLTPNGVQKDLELGSALVLHLMVTKIL